MLWIFSNWSLEYLSAICEMCTNFEISNTSFLDQDLIPYGYSVSACWCSCCSSCWERPFSKKPKTVVSNRIGIKFGSNACSSRKYASFEEVGFSIWRHAFQMAAMTSFHAESAAIWCVHTERLPCVCLGYGRTLLHISPLTIICLNFMIHSTLVLVRSGTDPISLLILFLLRRCSSKKP